MSLWAQESGFSRESLPFILLEDIYDLLTISQCEEGFLFFIFRIYMNKNTEFTNTTTNYLVLFFFSFRYI